MKIKVIILKYFLITLGFILNFNYSYSQNEIELFNLYKNQDYKSAESLIDKTINLYPNDPKVYFVSGNIYFELHTFEEAISMFSKAVEIDKDYIIAKINIGVIYSIIGKSNISLDLFTNLQKFTDRNLKPYIELSKDIFIKESLNGEIIEDDESLYKEMVELKYEEPSLNQYGVEERDPKVDLEKLSKFVVYPEEARRAGIQGKVIVRVLLEKSGKLRKYFIESSDNDLLNQAALDAIKNYGQLEPAIVRGKPIICWLSIPITFRLKDRK